MTHRIIGGLALAASLIVPLLLVLSGVSKVSPDTAAPHKRVLARALPHATAQGVAP